jgi:hypothetical protein
MNTMIILDKSKKQHHICPCCHFSNDMSHTTSLIPEFYSSQHAIDSGWVITTDPKFCPPHENYAWVCPNCIKDFKK